MKDTPIIAGIALLAVAIGVYFFLSGDVKNSSPASVSESQTSAVAVPFTPLVSGTRSTIAERVNYFITSSTQLNELWKLVDAKGQPPKVDFTKEAVIAVFAGQQPTGGYAIQVSKIVDSGARLVSITIQKPDDSCKPKVVVTMPYEIVTIPATTLPLAHEDILTTVPCP
ncbi:MAG: protease complex subunit PrcB family protein [Candidatus Paceibacterota bacterium]|jgi:hypothetical protein